MLLQRIGPLVPDADPLEPAEVPTPVPLERQVRLRVTACGVCHTELDEIEGRAPPPKLAVIPGHQVIGRVDALGPSADRHALGARVGVGWILRACGKCEFCGAGNENLCPEFKATGRDADGGYAEYMVVDEDFALPIPDAFSDVEAAPLLCAGAIGYRSLRLTGLRNGQDLGLTGFGASGHLSLKLARSLHPDSRVYVFARSEPERQFARELGATWVGDTEHEAPVKLDAIIDTTPAWTPVVEALKNLKPGGRLVVNAIRKEDHDKQVLQQLDYPGQLWLEKEIKSVANVTRQDISEFLELAARIPMKPEVQEYRLDQANQALLELKQRRIRGAKVLRPG